jgi:hypothetical protein
LGGGSGAGGGTSVGGGSSVGGGTSDHFSVAATPSAVSVGPGTSAVVRVDVTRPTSNFDEVDLRLLETDGGDASGSGFFALPSGYVTSTTLMVTAPFPSDGGVHPLVVALYPMGGTTQLASAPLTMTVRPGSGVLYIDDDGVGANQITALILSDNDKFVQNTLRARGVAFDWFVMPYYVDGGNLPLELVRPYAQMIWDTGDTWGPAFCFTPFDENVASAWLDLGGKKLLLVSDSYFYAVGEDSWGSTSNNFVSQYLGGMGTEYLSDFPPQRTFSGAAGQPTAGLTVLYGTCDYYESYLNPKAGTTTLFTETSPDSGWPIATKATTAAGSTVVFSGFGFQEIAGPDAGGTSKAVFNALLDAAGIP